MKKTVFISFIFLLSPVLVSAASLTDGLVGYWTFNGTDISGTTAYDRSGKGNNGALTNGPTKVMGKLGQGLYFDGVNDYVDISNPGLGSAFTISAWVKVSGLATKRPLYGEYEPTTNDARNFIQTSTDGKPAFDQWRPGGGAAISPSSLVNGKWYLLTGVQTANNFRTLYVDGVAVATSSEVYSGNTPTVFSIGRRYVVPSGDTFFKGIIDDMRLYNRALSASEVAALYKLGTATVNASKVSTPKDNLASGLVGYWTFNGTDISGTTAYDRSGKGNNGTLTNSPTKVAGKLGQGLSLIDTLSKYIEIPDTSALRLTGGGTITAWIKPNSLNAIAATIVDKGTTNTSTTDGYRFNITTSGQIGIRVNANTATKSTDNAYSFGKWTFAVGVIKPDGSVALYSNGVNVTGTPGSAVLPPDTTGVMRIGARATGTDRNFDGVIDDVHIYNRALSASEVVALYKLGTATVNAANKTGLVGYWSFDNSDINGTTAYDRSGKGNNGTLTNGPTKVAGKLGQGLNFNGTNYVNVGDPVNGSLDFTSSFSMSFWMKCSYISASGQAIAGKSYAQSISSGGGYGFRIDSGTNLLGFQVRDSVGGLVVSNSINAINDGKWHHVVGVRNHPGNTSYLYVDGVSNDTDVGSVATYASAIPFGLGARYRITSSDWVDTVLVAAYRGIIDDMRVYGRPLSASEVSALYKLGQTTVGKVK